MKERVAAAIGLCAFGLVFAVVKYSSDPEAPFAEVRERSAETISAPATDTGQRAPDKREPTLPVELRTTPLVGPNGQPLPPGTQLRKPGLPERGPPQAPLDDAEAWREVRAEASRAWEAQALQVAEEFATTRALTDEEREAMLEALRSYHQQLATVRSQVEAGEKSPPQARKEFGGLRQWVSEQLGMALGTERALALNEELSVLPGGGF